MADEDVKAKALETAYNNVDAAARRKFISDKKSAEQYQSQVDLSKQLVSHFKTLNDLHKSGNDSMGKMADFSNKILSDTKARGMITRQMESDIENAHDAVIQAKSKEFELSKKIQRSMVEQSLIAKMILRVNEDYKKNEQEKIDLSKQLLSLEAEMDDAQLRAIHNGEDLSAEYSSMMKQRDNLQKQIVKNGEEGESILKRELAIRAKMPESIKAQLETAQRAAEAAERELKARQQLLKDMKLQAGYMAHMEDASYAVLGPFGEMATKAKQLRENMKVIPLQFMLLDKLIKLGIERFVALDKAAEDFRKSTGFSNTQMVELRKNAESVNVELQEFGVGIKEAYDAAKALTDVFGNTSLVTKEAMTNVALMNANLNVAVEDSAAALATFQGLGGATQEAAMNMMKIGAGLSEKAGVPFSLVMKDIANAADQTLSMLSANPSKLMKASIAARALGTDMNKLVSSQRKLLDYSSSMNEELELSALLGRSISFQKSRQLAYDGDIAGAAKATLETVKAAGDFDKMSVYQREALAKASGMELKDLTKMMAVDKQKEEIRLRGTDEQKRQLAIQEETLKKLEEENDLSKQGLLADGERAIRQQKMQGLMTKMKNILDAITLAAADVLEPIITPLVKILIPAFKLLSFTAKLLSPIIKGMVYPIQFVAELIAEWTDGISNALDGAKGFKDFFENDIVKWALGVGGVVSLMFFGKGGFEKIMDMVKAPFKTVKDFGKNMLGKLTGKGAASDLAGDSVGKTAKATKDVNSGTGVKDFLTNLAAGLKEIGNAKVLFGAFNLIPASIGLIAMIPGFFGAFLLSKIDGKGLNDALSGMAEGLSKMASAKVALGAGALILASIGFAAMTLGSIGLAAVALLGAPVSVGLIALSAGLSALGANPVIWLGIAALAAIAVGFIGFGYAAKLAAESFAIVIDSFTKVGTALSGFKIVSDSIGSIVTAIGSIKTALIEFSKDAGVISATENMDTISKAIEIMAVNMQTASNGMGAFSRNMSAIVKPLETFSKIRIGASANEMKGLATALKNLGSSGSMWDNIKSFFSSDPIDKLEKISSMSDRLKIAAEAISSISTAANNFATVDSFAMSVGKLADSLNRLSDSLGNIKTEELAKLSAIGNATAATGTTKTSEQTAANMAGVEAKLDKLTELLVGGAIKVYIDGRNVSSVIASV